MEVRSLSAYDSLIRKIVEVEKIVGVWNIMGLVCLIDCVTLIVLFDITESDIVPVTLAIILLYYSTCHTD